jgi:hypothetical protein
MFFVPPDRAVAIATASVAFVFIIFLVLRTGYRAALKAQRKAAAPLVSPALDDFEPEEEVEELSSEGETILSRLKKLSEYYELEELTEIANGRSLTYEESDAFLEKLLEWDETEISSEEWDVFYKAAHQGSRLERYAGGLHGRAHRKQSREQM